MRERAARRLAAAVSGVLLGGSCPTPDIALHFSNTFAIEKSGFATRDLGKPFFFDLLPPNRGAPFGFVSDIGTDFDVWLATRVPPGSEGAQRRSLAFKIIADKDANIKDKILLSAVSHNSAEHIDLAGGDTVRFFGFDFMLDPTYDVPSAWLVHMQVWQCCAGHPPFTVRVTPGRDRHGPVEFTFGVIDDAQEAAHYGVPAIIYRMNVQRGIWNRMTFRLNPQFDGSVAPGGIKMWFNGVQAFDYRGFWSFQPGHTDAVTHQLFTSHLGIDLGIYRRRQTSKQIIYFDNISYGRDLADVQQCQ
jgi:hypothetical protein